MADKFPSRGDFTVPTCLYDEHEWMVDYLIDGELGTNCSLIFTPVYGPCDNCFIDTETRKSSHIYNGTGPQDFPNYTLCPRCNGRGTLSEPVTKNVRLRVYWDAKDWKKFGHSLQAPDASAMIIGYMDDAADLQNADTFKMVYENVEYECRTRGEAQPHGFRHNRYFIQFVDRV